MMPNRPTREHLPPTYEQIYQQIIVTQPKGGTARELNDTVRSVLGGAQIKFHRIGRIDELGISAIQLVPGADVPRALGLLRGAGKFRAVEQNRPLRLQAVDDPLYWDQWALRRMAAEPAWAHALRTLDPAAPGVIVAVIDSGINTAHPDLAGHLWDDGAGHHGRNLLTDTFDVSDADGHGTLLAGTIGAISNNATGIAAAEWPVRLMAVKFHDVQHPPNAWSGANAISWAVTNGARVLNGAWGVGVPFFCLRTALEFADANDAVFIAAAGNDGLDTDELPTFPAAYGAPPYNLPNVISVMASDADDDKAWFSNYGATTVHLAAPGVGVLSTHSYFGTPQWRPYSGTSPACAHVTYAAALLKAMNPRWTPTQIREHLVASVDNSPWLKCVAHGRLNLDRAARGPFAITSPQAGDAWPIGRNVQITWNRTYPTPQATTVSILLSEEDSPYTVIAAGQLNNGSCSVTAPLEALERAQIRIQSEQGPGLYAESGVFTVA
jgi:subtilisin family serine protease